MKQHPIATTLLVALVLADCGSPALAVRRLRTETVHKSRGRGASEGVSVADPDEAYDPFLGLGGEQGERDLQLIFGSLSIPVVSLSFSISLPGIGDGGLTQVVPATLPTTTEATTTTAAATTTTPTTTAGVTNPCVYCPNGIVDPNLEVAGNTCQTYVDYASSLEDTSADCIQLQQGAYTLCCPAQVESPCEFCAATGGITVDAEMEIPNADGTTCGLAATYAESIDATNEQCETVQMAEATCCPSDFQETEMSMSMSMATAVPTPAPASPTASPMEQVTWGPTKSPVQAPPSRSVCLFLRMCAVALILTF